MLAALDASWRVDQTGVRSVPCLAARTPRTLGFVIPVGWNVIMPGNHLIAFGSDPARVAEALIPIRGHAAGLGRLPDRVMRLPISVGSLLIAFLRFLTDPVGFLNRLMRTLIPFVEDLTGVERSPNRVPGCPDRFVGSSNPLEQRLIRVEVKRWWLMASRSRPELPPAP